MSSNEEEFRPTSPDEIMASIGARPNAPVVGAPNPTSASAWRSARKAGFIVILPSGNTARVRRTLDLFERLKKNSIPNPLAGIVQEMIQGKQAAVDISKLDEETTAQMLQLMDDTVVKMFIDPKVVSIPEDADISWEPPEGCISTADINLEDKVFLFGVAQGAVADAEQFRRQSEAAMADLQDGSGVEGSA